MASIFWVLPCEVVARAMLRPVIVYGIGAIVLWYLWMCGCECECEGRGITVVDVMGFEGMGYW